MSGSRAWSVAERGVPDKSPVMATVVAVHVSMLWQPATVHASQSADDSWSIPGLSCSPICSHIGPLAELSEHTAGALMPAR